MFAARYLEPSGRGRAIGALIALFVLVQALVLVARDPLTFLLGWEAMTLVPAAVILVGRADEVARRTVFFYVALTHLAGAGTWVAVLLLARGGSDRRPDRGLVGVGRAGRDRARRARRDGGEGGPDAAPRLAARSHTRSHRRPCRR